ncbi:MAG: hypothetical protein R2854_26745 [Caldilineaceae bacterium]
MLGLIGFMALFAIMLIGARVLGVGLPDETGLLKPQALVLPAFNRHVVLISGHAASIRASAPMRTTMSP